jgi:hypothetical protein
MTPQSINEIIEFLERNELHAFSVEDIAGKEKYEGFNSEKNTKDTVLRFTEVSAKLPSGTYKLKGWKIGGQANPYTRFFSVGSVNTTSHNVQTNDAQLMYKLGAMETELKLQRQIDTLNLTILQLKTNKSKKSKINPIHALIASSLMGSAIVQQKVADLMGDEKGQAFLLKMQSLQNQADDDDDDDGDEKEEEND